MCERVRPVDESPNGTPISVEILRGLGELEDVAQAWDELDGGRSPYMTSVWTAEWFRSFGSGSLRVAVARRGERIVGILPFQASEGRTGRVLATANDESGLFGPLATDREVVRALVHRILLEHRPNTISFRDLAGEADSTEWLMRSIESEGYRCVVERQDEFSVVDLAGTLEQYMSNALSRNARAQIRKHRRRLEREHETRFEPLVRPRDLESEMKAAFDVEASGWKGRKGTAIRSSRDTMIFYERIAREFHKRDALRLSRLWIDGDLAAIDIAVIHGGTLHSLKMGFLERWGRFAPGIVLRMAVIEAAFAQGLAANDLGPGGAHTQTKRRFRTRTERLVRLTAFRSCVRGLIGYAAARCLLSARKWINRLRAAASRGTARHRRRRAA